MQAAGRTSRRVPHGTARNTRKDECVQDQSAPLSCAQDPPDARISTNPPQPDKAFPTPDPPSADPDISPERIQAALVTALQSREFQSAPQLRAFLGFVVRATLNNEQEKLKGYTIAVEALGRPEDFNPVTDPIVRVEAARLRRRLEKYYSGTGAGETVRMVIRKGSYAPEFFLHELTKLRDQPAGDVLALQEEEAHFSPAPAVDQIGQDGETATPVRHALPGPDAIMQEKTVTVPQDFRPRDRFGRFLLQLAQLARRPVPLQLTLLVGIVCFLAGYLIAAD
ncbi:hypothetical protein [Roseibium sp. Sym1]|uniref:hypothetical protein n=1 Tax=Roseibium sp. Sym1 TaxID=3016006 RepID=UPI0022B2CABB|nr:hypothetical protein [Roseibium sp. Sym1]